MIRSVFKSSSPKALLEDSQHTTGDVGKSITALVDRIKPSIFKWLMNRYAPMRGAGIQIKAIDPDYRFIEVQMPLTRRNKNAVGTQFGGSLYAMSDPFYMLMLMQILGKRYHVWDQDAAIEFKAPGKGTVHARYEISDADLNRIQIQTEGGQKHLHQFTANICHLDGSVVAVVRKTVYIRLKKQYRPVEQAA